MKCIVYSKYGSSDVLQYVDRPTPELGDGELLLQMKAASINPIDWRLQEGEARLVMPLFRERVPGFDCSGIVEKTSKGSKFSIGDRVAAFIGAPRGGCFAEQVAAPEHLVCQLPESVSFSAGAGVGLAGSTALQCLRDYGRLGAGHRVAITGASGGVGTIAVQLAARMGAEVIAVCSARNFDLVASLGASKCIDYHDEDHMRQIPKCDVFFDAAGKTDFGDAKPALRTDGAFITTEPNLKTISMTLWTMMGSKKRFHTMLVKPSGRDLRELITLLDREQLRVIINRTFVLQQASQAQDDAKSGEGTGKTILEPQDATIEASQIPDFANPPITDAPHLHD